jgi:hypothetical protein
MSVKSAFLTKIGKAPYSAIAYKDGDLYVAEDNTGTVIEENTSASTVIQAALDYEAGRILCLDGDYEISSPISVPSHRILEGESRKTVFEQPASPIEELIKNDYVGGSTDIIIKNLTLDGKSRGVDWKHGIWVQNVSRFEISGIYGLNFTGDGGGEANNLIVVGHTTVAGRTVSYGRIHNIYGDTIQGDTVYATGKDAASEFTTYINVYDVISKNCTWITVDFNEVKFSNIANVIGHNPGDICVNLDGCHYCNINNVVAYTPRIGLCFSAHAGGGTGKCSHNIASNITCYQPTSDGIWIWNATGNAISDFVLYGGTETGNALHIHAHGAGNPDEGIASGNTFINGIITEPKNEGLVSLETTGSDDASNNSFTNIKIKKVTGTTKSGFVIDGKHSSVIGCDVYGSCIAKGIHLRSGADSCTIAGCQIYDVDSIGIQVEAGNNIINSCNAEMCELSGFYSSVARNNFTNCFSKSNGQNGAGTYKDGFSFYGAISHYSTIVGCVATGNAAYGVKGHSTPNYLLLTGNVLTGNTSGSTNTLGANSKADANNNFL